MRGKGSRLLSRYRVEDGAVCIDVRVDSAAEIFDSRDPAPFRKRDLDPGFFEYICDSVQEIGHRHPTKIVIFIPREGLLAHGSEGLISGIREYFQYEYNNKLEDLRLEIRKAAVSLLIGIVFLATCVSLALMLKAPPKARFEEVLRTGLVIVGWVAMWHPANLMLYAWWPKLRPFRIRRTLTRLPIEVR